VPAVLVGQIQQYPRQPPRQVEEEDVGQLGVQAADMAGQRLQHVQGEVGVVGQVVHELFAVQRPRFGRLQGDGRGRARRVVEQGQLTEEVAGAKDGQDDLLPFGRGMADLDLTAADHVEQPARVAQVKNHLAGAEAARHEGFG